jgi:hypothetical protein
VMLQHTRYSSNCIIIVTFSIASLESCRYPLLA